MRVVASVLVLCSAGVVPAAAQRDGLSLAEVTTVVRREGRAVRLAALTRAEATARAWSAASRLLPEITVVGSYQRNLRVRQAFLPARLFDPSAPDDELRPVRFGSDNEWRLAFTANLAVVDPESWFGAAGAAAARAEIEARANGEAVSAAARAQIVALDVLLAVERHALTERSLARLEALLADVRARRAAELASDVDVARLEVEARRVALLARRDLAALRSARRHLALALAADPAEPPTVHGALGSDAADTARLGALTLAMLDGVAGIDPGLDRDGRPDVVAARARASADARFSSAARASFLPRITMFSSVDLAAQQNGRPDFFGAPTQRATGLTAGVRVELPLLGSAAYGRAALAGAVAHASALALAARRDSAAAEVADRVATLEEAAARVADEAAAVRASQRGYAIAAAAFGAGSGSRLDVSDAEVALRTAEFGFAAAVHGVLAARVRFDEARGVSTDGARLDRWLAAPARAPTAEAGRE